MGVQARPAAAAAAAAAPPDCQEVPVPPLSRADVDAAQRHYHDALVQFSAEDPEKCAGVIVAVARHQEQLAAGAAAPVRTFGTVCKLLSGSYVDLMRNLRASPHFGGRVRVIGREGAHIHLSLTLVLPADGDGDALLRVVLPALLPGVNASEEEPPPEGRNAGMKDAADEETELEQLAFRCPALESAAALHERASQAGGYARGVHLDAGGATVVLEFGETAAAKAAREAAGEPSPAELFRAQVGGAGGAPPRA